MTDNKYYINWEDFHQHAKKLARLLSTSGEFNKIIAVSRGGLIPAGVVAYEMGIRFCETINMSSYDGNYQRRPDSQIELSANVSEVDSHTVIIDDMADTGRTFNILRSKCPSAKFAAVYTKSEGAKSVDIYAEKLPDEWIVFPWDL